MDTVNSYLPDYGIICSYVDMIRTRKLKVCGHDKKWAIEGVSHTNVQEFAALFATHNCMAVMDTHSTRDSSIHRHRTSIHDTINNR